MKKFINKINSKATELAIRTKTALASKSGEGYIDTAVKIIIGVVVGGVILVGLYALFTEAFELVSPKTISKHDLTHRHLAYYRS